MQTYTKPLTPLTFNQAPKTPVISGPVVNQPVRPTPAPVAPRPVAPVAPTPVVPAPVATSVVAPTPAAVYGADLNTYNPQDEYDIALLNQIKKNKTDSEQVVSPEQIYRDKLKQYQGEIDAVNTLYREKLRVEGIAGQGRLGSGRAIQGRSGLLGSDFASAQNDTIGQNNTDILSGIQGEQTLAIQTILGLARKDAVDEAAAKNLAKQQGGADYLKFLGVRSTRRSSKLDAFLSTLGDTDLTKVSPTNLAEVAKSYGITVDELKTKAKEVKDAKTVAANEADLKTRKSEADIAKIEADIAAGKLQIIGEGNKLFNTETGEVVAYNPKTSARSSGGKSVVPVGGESSFVAQTNYSKLNAKQKTQADSLNNLVRTLGEYKTYYNANPGVLGGKIGNMFGADAALLETKLNSIIFAAAQAEGTGALQAADREVIENIIPNPTSAKGAFNTFKKGGKTGNIAKIEDQIQKYTANLSGFGLSPVNSAPPQNNVSGAIPATLRSPNGKQEVDIKDLSPAEIQEAQDAGWQ